MEFQLFWNLKFLSYFSADGSKPKWNATNLEIKKCLEQFQTETPVFHEGIIPQIITLAFEIYRSSSFNCFHQNNVCNGTMPNLTEMERLGNGRGEGAECWEKENGIFFGVTWIISNLLTQIPTPWQPSLCHHSHEVTFPVCPKDIPCYFSWKR